MFCIDAGPTEFLLAKQLGYDAVITHHPAGGSAILGFPKVFMRHVQLMVDAGVPLEKAEVAVKRKFEQLTVEAHMRNYAHNVDFARFLKMLFMNIHMPLDEIGRKRMVEQINKKVRENSTVGDVVFALMELPEFRNALTKINVCLGKKESKAGKVVVSHAAATNGGYEIAKTYFEHGVDILIYIHISPLDLERLREEGKSDLIVTGHIASDSLGINPFIHELERRGLIVTKFGVIEDTATKA